ncbi:uncharacterized protein LOC127701654 [Mytilus californianus]|uniref:uncharacterized protein LOC127701654 n=1 Tax=Mytilus californianus TaxID=6549 RepID=UPI0022479BB4|nr:uncharacterized protein LOC127701654 [Mytilus californianus]
MDSSNNENKPADLYENTHTRTTNVDGSEATSTRTTNVDGSEPTSTKKQQIKMYSVHPGMVQSITNFENNRVLYNAFRKYKLSSQKRQRRSISIPSFLQKPIKVYNNAYGTGKRNQNSIHIKGTNKVRKIFFEVPNNIHSKIETPTESYNDSKVLKTQPEIEVLLNYALENTKNPVYQSDKKSESLGVVIHQYTTEKPTLQKRKKSRHTKRHIKDRLFRRISKSLSNGLPIYSKANKESILEKKPTEFFPGNELSHGSGIRINLGNIQQTLQENSEMIRSKDVLKVNKNKFDLSPSKTFMSIDHNPVSKTKIRPKNIFYDTKFELPKSSNPADIKEKDNIPKQNNQWYEMPQSNLKPIFKTHQHDKNKDNNDNNNNLLPVDTAMPLNRRKMPTYKFPFKHSNQMNDKPTKTEEIKPTKILSYHSSDTSSSGLSSKPGKSFVYNPQQHHDSITDRTKFISGLSEFNDIAVENDFPNFNKEKPSESNLNAHTDNMPSVNDIGTDQIEKSRLDPNRPNVINLSNIKIVPGGCIIEGRFYRYEDLPKFIQEFYDNKTKNEHLELSLGDVENVLNDYTENKGSISQSFSTEFPMLELIKGKDASPFSIQLPEDSQGYDILAGPHLHESSRQLAVLQANNFAAGNERFGTPRTMVSRPDIHNRQTKIKGKENNRQLFNPVLKWSEGVSDKAWTGLAPVANYQVASDIRVVNSLSPGHFGAQNKNTNDYRTYKLNGNSFGSYNNEMKEVISLPGMGIKDQKVLTKFFNPIHISSKQTVSLVQRKNSESPPSTKRPNEGSKLYLNDVNTEKSHQNKFLKGASGDIILRGFLDIPLNSMSGKLTLSKALKKTANQKTQSNGVAKKLGLVRKQAKQDANSNGKADKLVFKNPVQDEAYHDAYANNDADKLDLKSPVQDKAIHDLHSNGVANILGHNSLLREKANRNIQSNGVADKLSLMSKVKDKANQDAQLNGVAYKLGSKSPVQDKATLDVRSNGVADKLSLKSEVQDKANQDAQSNGVANKLGFSSSVRGKANKDAQYNGVAKLGLKNVVKLPAKHVPSERVLHSAIQEKTNYKDQSNGKTDKLNSNKGIQENVHRDTTIVDTVSSVSTRPKDKYPHDTRMNSLEEKLKKHTGIHGTSHNDMWLNGLDGKPSSSLNTGIQNKNPNDVKLNGVATKKRLNSRKQDKTTRHDKQLNRVVSVNTKIPEKSVLQDITLKQKDKVLLLLKDNKRNLDHLNNNAFTNLKSILKATSSAQKSVASHVRSVKKELGPRTFFDIIENNIISPFKSVPKVTHLKDNFASNFNLGEILKNGMSAFNYEPVTFPNFIAPPKRNLIITPTASIPLHLSGQHNLDTIMHEIVTSPFGTRQNSIMDIFG